MQNKPYKLTTPDLSDDEKWWERYPRLNSSRFTYHASGYEHGIPCPYQVAIDEPGIEPTPYLAYNTFVKGWSVVGYTLHPFWIAQSRSDHVAIMFERDNGECVWFHFPK